MVKLEKQKPKEAKEVRRGSKEVVMTALKT
jgi:hypothetical protein